MNKILAWQRLDNPTRERASISTDEDGGVLVQSSISGAYEGRPIDLAYTLRLRADWLWESFSIFNRCGPDVQLRRSDEAKFDVPFLDFFLTPLTNTSPIRRLKLDIGQKTEIETLYFHPQTFAPAIEAQTYERLGENLYRFTSDGGAFTALVDVDAEGWVTDYEGLFRRLPEHLS